VGVPNRTPVIPSREAACSPAMLGAGAADLKGIGSAMDGPAVRPFRTLKWSLDLRDRGDSIRGGLIHSC